jgi:ATP-binding cassette subfamily B protein
LDKRDSVIACLELDLTPRLHFGQGVVILTERQVLAKAPGEADWKRWDLRPGLRLEHRDHAGVGTLDLRDETSLLARWRHTLGRDAALRRITEQFQEHLSALG